MSARELMVSLWYPAVLSDGRRARYMAPAESELLLANDGITGAERKHLMSALAKIHRSAR